VLPGEGPGRLISVESGGRVVLEEAVLRGATENGLQATGAETELTDVRVEAGGQHGLVTAADARLTAVDLRVADHGASGILSRFGAMSLTRVALIDNDVGLRFGRGAEPQHTLRFFQGNRVPWIACGLFCPVAGPVLGP
ncbi:MAG: hypothetical protein KC583_15735, partial [Myxococcales bacterium]|nr:hypothetical protein [Myxococcales bacterium]